MTAKRVELQDDLDLMERQLAAIDVLTGRADDRLMDAAEAAATVTELYERDYRKVSSTIMAGTRDELITEIAQANKELELLK